MAFLEKYEIKKNVNEYEMNKKNKMIHTYEIFTFRSSTNFGGFMILGCSLCLFVIISTRPNSESVLEKSILKVFLVLLIRDVES